WSAPWIRFAGSEFRRLSASGLRHLQQLVLSSYLTTISCIYAESLLSAARDSKTFHQYTTHMLSNLFPDGTISLLFYPKKPPFVVKNTSSAWYLENIAWMVICFP